MIRATAVDGARAESHSFLHELVYDGFGRFGDQSLPQPIVLELCPRPVSPNDKRPLTQGGANMMPGSDFQMNARPASSINEWLDPTRNLDWIAAAVHPD